MAVDSLLARPGRMAVEPSIALAIDGKVGVGVERPAKASPAFARRLLAGRRALGFPALGRRQRGIVQCLRRPLMPSQRRFQFRDPRQHRVQLADKGQQRQDQRVLLGNRQLGKGSVGYHPNVESNHP